MPAYTLQTTIVAPTAAAAADLDGRAFVARTLLGKYSTALTSTAADALNRHARQTLIRAAFVAGQICKETGNFAFGGAVSPSQMNWAGIGATNDGAAGNVFATGGGTAQIVDAAVAAVFAHHCSYLYGAFANWPERCAYLKPYAVRNAAVVGKFGARGIVAVIGDYTNGRWAYSPQYAEGTLDNGYARGIVEIANALRLEKGGTMPAPRIAVSAGHHNQDGGNPYEIRQTAELAEQVYVQGKRAGFDIVALTDDGPDSDDLPGDAMMPMGLQAIASKVNALRPLPVLFLELHTEGGGGTGVFGIYPDKAGDTDTDVRDTLAPLMARKVAARTGLGVRAPGWLDPRRGPGVMSERETGVGSNADDRLGVFYATAPVRADVSRMILEVGAHDKEPDLSISKRPDFAANAAAGVIDALRVWTGYDNGVDTLAGGAGKVPITMDEAAALKQWIDGLIPFEGRGDLRREGIADLREFGGKQEERIAIYERIVAHRLAGRNYVMSLDVWDSLRASQRIVIY